MANVLVNSLGGFSQLGMIVADADKTMRYMTEKLGIGPFFVIRKITPEHFYFRGAPAAAPLMTLGFAQVGGMQIEVIQQHNDTPSAYTEFLAAGREGAQHASIWLGRDAYTDAREKLIGNGLTIVHESRTPTQGRFAYFSTDVPGGFMVEIAEALSPGSPTLFDSVAQAAQGWDGTDPIRNIG
ncbi:MAG: VOC family protein [Rhodospirillaceae bacterium]|nr:MAG: VOC family protein [Rhodospirillaceae bacterium]